jgi:N-acetyl-gamma-glutamyl-phosphate reductase
VFEEKIAASRRVSNPGCYATGVQLALWPIKDLLADVPWAFGVSGFSGAGRTPSPRNDPLALGGNLMPYHLIDHSHEAEIERHLGHYVRLLPHVAEFFRGISLTISFKLAQARTEDELHAAYREFFDPHRLLVYDAAIPEIRQVRETPSCRVGGLQRDPRDVRRWIVVSALDNLSKGAATQAIQNINLMFGFDSSLGLIRD